MDRYGAIKEKLSKFLGTVANTIIFEFTIINLILKACKKYLFFILSLGSAYYSAVAWPQSTQASRI